jgi:branched-chain amino acid transport system substrate-binding protein
MENMSSINQKNILFGIIVFVILVIAGLMFFQKHNIASTENIKIGIIGHFSGAYADYGIPMKQAAELAVEEVNNNGGINNRLIELVVEDDNSDPNTAATAMNKLIAVDKLDYIISAEGSGITSAVAPIAQANKKLLMITLGSSPDLTAVGNYIFRSIPSDSYQGVKMNDFINTILKSKSVAGLYLNDAYGVGIKKIIDSNKNVVNSDSEMFESSATDFRTQLLKIKASGADTLVIVAHDEYPLILKQIKELNLNVKIMASETFKDANLVKSSGSVAEGVYIAFMATPEDFVSFNHNYQAKFTAEPSAYSMYAYDGAMALIKALDNADSVDSVRKNLFKINFNGASGNVGFSSDRDRIGNIYTMYTVKNGQIISL